MSKPIDKLVLGAVNDLALIGVIAYAGLISHSIISALLWGVITFVADLAIIHLGIKDIDRALKDKKYVQQVADDQQWLMGLVRVALVFTIRYIYI